MDLLLISIKHFYGKSVEKVLNTFEKKAVSDPTPSGTFGLETLLWRMTARFEIQLAFFTVDNFPLLYIIENSKMAPPKANFFTKY